MRRAAATLLIVSSSWVVVGCTNPLDKPTAQGAAQAETSSPPGSPLAYRVLAEEINKQANTVEYHALVATQPKHDEADALLKFLYKHLMTRTEDHPAGVAAYVYSDEAQYKTPPRSPIGSVVLKPGDVGPTFENKVPLEFWQQIDQAVSHTDKGWKLEKKIERNDPGKALTITQPYTEPGEDRWADKLSFNQAMVVFTDATKELFEKVPELRGMTFIGRWKDQDVVKISLTRPQYQAVNLADLEEQIGQLHGRAFLELSTGKGTDASVAKGNAQRMAGLYKKMLGQLKGQTWVSPTLK
jgi:quinol monooxygenase YgiN